MRSRWYTNFRRARREEYGEDAELTEESGRERYYRQIREIRKTLEISHDEARRRWSDYYAPGGDPIKPVKKISLAIRASTTGVKVCPFCRDAIFHPDEGGPDHTCDACGAHYHLDCFEQELGGRCATLGCAARRAISRVSARARQARGTTQQGVTPPSRARGLRGHRRDPQQELLQEAQEAQEAAERSEQERVRRDECDQQAPRQRVWDSLTPNQAFLLFLILALGIVLRFVLWSGS